MRARLFFLFLLMAPGVSFADLASTEYVNDYVNQSTETKVDTSASANQTMAGTYTVSGSLTVTGAFKVPTPPLPNPDAD